MGMGAETVPGAATVGSGPGTVLPEALASGDLARQDAMAEGSRGGLMLSLPPELAGLVRHAAVLRGALPRRLLLDVVEAVFGDNLLPAVLDL